MAAREDEGCRLASQKGSAEVQRVSGTWRMQLWEQTLKELAQKTSNQVNSAPSQDKLSKGPMTIT